MSFIEDNAVLGGGANVSTRDVSGSVSMPQGEAKEFSLSKTFALGKIIFVATVPGFFRFFRGQFLQLKSFGDVLIVASPGKELAEIAMAENTRFLEIFIARRISVLSDILALWRLFLLFLKERPNIVHGNTPKGALLAMCAGFFARVPVRVYMCHGLCYSTAGGLKKTILRAMEKLTCVFSTHVLAVSHGLSKELVSLGFCRKNKVSIILNGCVSGVDIDRFCPGNVVEAKKNLGVEANFVFGFVGRIVRDKGVEELVRAFERLHAEFSDIRLLMLGREETANAISSETSRRIKENPNIITPGFQENLVPYYRAMDTFVFPSYREGFGMAVAEAGATGVPCIVSDINGCNEIILEGQNGTIIPKADETALYSAMKRFYEERHTTLPQMAARSRDLIASRYEQKAVWHATREVYRNLITQ